MLILFILSFSNNKTIMSDDKYLFLLTNIHNLISISILSDKLKSQYQELAWIIIGCYSDNYHLNHI